MLAKTLRWRHAFAKRPFYDVHLGIPSDVVYIVISWDIQGSGLFERNLVCFGIVLGEKNK